MNFSVVIPLYNKSYSIESCIDSVLLQSYQNFEIIIVNDGSTDDSVQKVIQNYSNEITLGKIKLIKQSNKGVSIARNNGVLASSFDYVCFLDADDEWKTSFLYSMKLLIEDYPLAALYCLQHETKLINQRAIPNSSYYKPGFRGYVNNFFKASIFGSVANSSKVCVKKEFFMTTGGFPEHEKSGEDLFVWMELARIYKVAFYNEVNVRINAIEDLSRSGRNLSIPYPFVYYSQPENIHKLSTWSRIYLRKVYLAHIKESLLSKQYDALFYRATVGSNLFPIISRPFIILSSIKVKS